MRPNDIDIGIEIVYSSKEDLPNIDIDGSTGMGPEVDGEGVVSVRKVNTTPKTKTKKKSPALNQRSKSGSICCTCQPRPGPRGGGADGLNDTPSTRGVEQNTTTHMTR